MMLFSDACCVATGPTSYGFEQTVAARATYAFVTDCTAAAAAALWPCATAGLIRSA